MITVIANQEHAGRERIVLQFLGAMVGQQLPVMTTAMMQTGTRCIMELITIHPGFLLPEINTKCFQLANGHLVHIQIRVL
jgi:hypothetical protein